MNRKTSFSTKFEAVYGIGMAGDKETILYPDAGAGMVTIYHDDVQSFDATIANIHLVIAAPALFRLLEESLEVTAMLWAELAVNTPSVEAGDLLTDFEQRASAQLDMLKTKGQE